MSTQVQVYTRPPGPAAVAYTHQATPGLVYTVQKDDVHDIPLLSMLWKDSKKKKSSTQDPGVSLK